jgi:iron-sulfur cluster assembly protein
VLTVSQDAAMLVCTLRRDADLPTEAGLRIVVDRNHQSLSMGLARNPEPQDEVVSSDGAHIFLSQSAARRLGQRTLRAEISAGRSLFFLDS